MLYRRRDHASRGTEQPAQPNAILVPDADGAGLQLAALIRGADEDTGDVVVEEWRVPLEDSVCGRFYPTGLAALCADVSVDPDYRGFPGGRTRSSLTIPVGPPDRVMAVISLEAPWVGAFSMRDYGKTTERAANAVVTFPAVGLDG